MQEQYYEELGMTEKELLEKYPFTTLNQNHPFNGWF